MMEINDAIMFLRKWNDQKALETTGRKSHELDKAIAMEDIVETQEYFLGYAEALHDLSQYFYFIRGPLREKELEIQEKIEELGKKTVDHYGYDGYMDKPKG
jgi:hypothetical protein